jgi:hypothetical protein
MEKDKLLEMLAGMTEKMTDKPVQPAGWESVAVLNAETLALKKAMDREIKRIVEEDSLLYMKHLALEAQGNVIKKEFWGRLYQVHGLPVDQHYIIEGDRILIDPGTKSV